ncbi:transcriptional regulator [Pseudomonas floridensis]|uniref:Transcriptional regulator n=1 Tax=Pseudomonas floridensis TaxID=1958950 RepID=A0A1X0N8C1_9PSED|nr:helix-turn-helix transcriptional regulator [Pseudomonas floridensis]ORC59283.1 transcriptional regulator [Pseudomonas floridensis]
MTSRREDRFASRLRAERDRLGLSQKDFARFAGVEVNAQGHYERGERTPRADYLAAISAIGVDIAYLVTGVPRVIDTHHLSQREGTVVRAFRTLGDSDQDALTLILEKLSRVKNQVM